MIAAASDAIWNNRAACGRRYRVGATNLGVPQPCRGDRPLMLRLWITALLRHVTELSISPNKLLPKLPTLTLAKSGSNTPRSDPEVLIGIDRIIYDMVLLYIYYRN